MCLLDLFGGKDKLKLFFDALMGKQDHLNSRGSGESLSRKSHSSREGKEEEDINEKISLGETSESSEVDSNISPLQNGSNSSGNENITPPEVRKVTIPDYPKFPDTEMSSEKMNETTKSILKRREEVETNSQYASHPKVKSDPSNIYTENNIGGTNGEKELYSPSIGMTEPVKTPLK